MQLIEAAGPSQEDSQDFYVSWNITCLFDALVEDRASSLGEDVAQVLKLKIHGLGPEEDDLGFTVSYKQLGAPAILRLSPEVEHLEVANGHAESWRNPSILLGPTSAPLDDTIKDDATTAATGGVREPESPCIEGPPSEDASGCRGLQCTFQWTLNKASNALRKMCPFRSGTSTRVHCQSEPVSDSIFHDELDVGDLSSDHLSSTHHNKSRNDPSASFPTSLPTSATFSSTPTEVSPAKPQRTDQVLRAVKVTSLIIILVSLSVILAAHLMHPRRRVDRAASREERRNKRLYRCAARRQKWRNWVGKFRRRDRPPTGGSWGEKHTADGLTEREGSETAEVMHTGIGELRDAHTIVSDLVRAEEGRGLHISELDGREIRRGRRRGSNLSGYESEESGPPAYDDKVFVIDGVAFVDGFHYLPAGIGIEDTPDSSVIETSPRISMELARSDSGKE